MKLKNLSNTISNLIVKNQTDNNSKNNFALIEFDPIKYKKSLTNQIAFMEKFICIIDIDLYFIISNH